MPERRDYTEGEAGCVDQHIRRHISELAELVQVLLAQLLRDAVSIHQWWKDASKIGDVQLLIVSHVWRWRSRRQRARQEGRRMRAERAKRMKEEEEEEEERRCSDVWDAAAAAQTWTRDSRTPTNCCSPTHYAEARVPT